MRILLIVLMLVNVASCARLRSVSNTSIPEKKGRVVTAEVTNNIIFLFNFSNAYVNELPRKLAEQCPNGKVQGLLTKDEVVTYFPLIFYREVITAEGYCNE